MEFEISKDLITKDIVFRGRITLDSFQELAYFDNLESFVLGSDLESASDHLMALQIIFAKHEQRLQELEEKKREKTA